MPDELDAVELKEQPSLPESQVLLEKALAKTMAKLDIALDKPKLPTKELVKLGTLLSKLTPLIRPKPPPPRAIGFDADGFMERLRHCLTGVDVNAAVTGMQQRITVLSKAGRPPRTIETAKCEVVEEETDAG